MAAVPSIGRATRIEGALAPEAELTRALYERYAAQILRYCVHQLGSREEAEDAVQSTFLNAFRGIKRGIVPEVESAWLFKIAHNVCLSRRRSAWRRDRVESPTDFEIVEEVTAAPTRRADELIGLQDVLEQMPEQQRRAILLREWQGLSYREVGEELELSQAAVETLIFRARRSLAQGLEQPVVLETRKRKRLAAGALANLVSSAQSFLLGGGAAAKVAAVVVVAGAGTVVATAPVHHRAFSGHAEQPAPPVRQQHAAPAPVRARAAVVAPARTAPLRRHAARQRAAHRRVHTLSPAASVVSPGSTSAPTTAVVPPVVAQPVETPPVITATGKDTAPGQLKKETGSAPRGKGRDNAPGRLKKVGTAATAAPAASDNGKKDSGKKNAPGRQKKGTGAVPPTSGSTPVVVQPVPTPDHPGNGNGKGK